MKKDNHYFAWGLTAVCVVCAVLLIYDLIFRDSIVMAYAGMLVDILAPVLYGAAMAYLLAPIVNWFERIILRRRGRAPSKWRRAISVALTWIVVLALLYALFSVLLPELYASVVQLVDNAQRYYYTVYDWVIHLLESNPEFAARASEVINEYYTDALAWLNVNLVPQLQVAAQAVTGGVVGVFVFLKNLLLGIIISVYLLAEKEAFSAGCSKLCYTLLPEDKAALFIRGVKTTDRIFAGFVRGKLLDSLIIGVLCFIGLSILKMPYTMLVSVIVGVTNVIPFFGPYIGAVPSTILIMLASPIQGVYFIIFILLLQQFDGNILGPKILGDSTGLSAFWVIVAILLGGGLFGFVGMVMGVPSFAVMYYIVQMLINSHLERKNLPTGSEYYDTMSYVDDAGVYYHSEETENIAES